jgi:hypothetical protein
VSQLGSYRTRAILIIVATIVAMSAIGVYVIASVIGGTSDAANGRTYSDTLGDAQQKFGDGAKVVKVKVDGGGVKYEVLSPDNSTVMVRSYTRTSEEHVENGNGQFGTAYTNHTDDSQRAATPADVKGAAVTIGQLDPDVVDRLWDQASFPHGGSTAILQGSTWTIGSGARPFDKYSANFDGSGFHQTQSQSDVFGGGPTTSAPAPTPAPMGVPPATAKRAAAIGACLRRAHGDPAKIQTCVGQ